VAVCGKDDNKAGKEQMAAISNHSVIEVATCADIQPAVVKLKKFIEAAFQQTLPVEYRNSTRDTLKPLYVGAYLVSFDFLHSYFFAFVLLTCVIACMSAIRQSKFKCPIADVKQVNGSSVTVPPGWRVTVFKNPKLRAIFAPVVRKECKMHELEEREARARRARTAVFERTRQQCAPSVPSVPSAPPSVLNALASIFAPSSVSSFSSGPSLFSALSFSSGPSVFSAPSFSSGPSVSSVSVSVSAQCPSCKASMSSIGFCTYCVNSGGARRVETKITLSTPAAVPVSASIPISASTPTPDVTFFAKIADLAKAAAAYFADEPNERSVLLSELEIEEMPTPTSTTTSSAPASGVPQPRYRKREKQVDKFAKGRTAQNTGLFAYLLPLYVQASAETRKHGFELCMEPGGRNMRIVRI